MIALVSLAKKNVMLARKVRKITPYTRAYTTSMREVLGRLPLARTNRPNKPVHDYNGFALDNIGCSRTERKSCFPMSLTSSSSSRDRNMHGGIWRRRSTSSRDALRY